GLKRSKALPSVTPAAVRRNSRRDHASWRLISSGEDAATKPLRARDERKDVMSTSSATFIPWPQDHSSPNTQTAGLLLSAGLGQPCVRSEPSDISGTAPVHGLFRRYEHRLDRAGNSHLPGLDLTSAPAHIPGLLRHVCSGP